MQSFLGVNAVYRCCREEAWQPQPPLRRRSAGIARCGTWGTTVIFSLFANLALAQEPAYPSREYIRLGSRVVAIEQPTFAPCVSSAITPEVPINVATTAGGEQVRLLFCGTSGQQVSLQVTNSTYAGCYSMTISIVKPDGSTLVSANVCDSSNGFLDSQMLPVSGTFTVVVAPQGANTGSATLLLSSYSDLTSLITPDIPVNITTTSPGQNAKLTFSGSAGQTVSLDLTNSTYNSGGCYSLTASILKPDGTKLGSASTCGASGAFLDTQALTIPGTYTVLLDPYGTATVSVTVRLNSYAEVVYASREPIW